jgi:hypothetical protein
MELNRKGRRTLSSNKNIKMEITQEQKDAYAQIVKLMNDNGLEFTVNQTYNITVAPKKVVESVQQAPTPEIHKVIDVE